jgi:hypothetical protein
MSKFFVGQRVRLARPVIPSNLGITGRIVIFHYWKSGTECKDGTLLKGDADCEVKWDGDIQTAAHTDQLEPLLDTPCESEFKESLDKLCENLETEHAR